MSFLRQLAYEDALSETAFYLSMGLVIFMTLLFHHWRVHEFFEDLYKIQAASLAAKHTSQAK